MLGYWREWILHIIDQQHILWIWSGSLKGNCDSNVYYVVSCWTYRIMKLSNSVWGTQETCDQGARMQEKFRERWRTKPNHGTAWCFQEDGYGNRISWCCKTWPIFWLYIVYIDLWDLRIALCHKMEVLFSETDAPEGLRGWDVAWWATSESERSVSASGIVLLRMLWKPSSRWRLVVVAGEGGGFLRGMIPKVWKTYVALCKCCQGSRKRCGAHGCVNSRRRYEP